MEESLRGKLLVASPALVDPNFARTVVFMTEHNDEGAMGIVLNRPSETAVESVVAGAGRDRAAASPSTSAVPCSPRRSCCWPSSPTWRPRPGSWSPTSGSPRRTSSWTSSPGRCAEGGFTRVIRAGGPGQLEAEMEVDSWIVEPPLPAELFPEDPATLWSDVLARKGGQYSLIARMPADPSLN